MVSPQIIGIAAFIVIFGSALAGLWLSTRLPAQHTSPETRQAVGLATAIVGTMAALVLGFLISTANRAFADRTDTIADLAVDILRLDDLLEHYGPETEPMRMSLLGYAKLKKSELDAQTPGQPARAPLELLHSIETLMYDLQPADARQREVLVDVDRVLGRITDARWLLVEQSGAVLPLPLLVLLGFWLAVIFASIGVFAPMNGTSVAALFLCSIAVSGGIYMIMDLGAPKLGLLQPTLQPLVDTIAAMHLQMPFSQ